MPRGMDKDKLGDLYSGTELNQHGAAHDKRHRAKKLWFDRISHVNPGTQSHIMCIYIYI